MKILIDLQACQSASRSRGIGRYSLALAKAIIRNAGSHEVSILLNASFEDTALALRQEFSEILANQNIHIFRIPTPTVELDSSNAWRARAAELIREYAISELKPDVIHISTLFEGFKEDIVTSIKKLNATTIHAVTLYDLIPYFEPDTYFISPKHRAWYDDRINNLKKADCLLAISEYTKNEAIQALGLQANTVTNIAGAVNPCFQPMTLSESDWLRMNRRFKIHKPFVLFIGSADTHKNLDNMVKAFALLPESLQTTLQLVVVSQMTGDVQARLAQLTSEHQLLEDTLCLTGFVPDEDLVLLYNACQTFCFPSIREGFGLPILEAMTCGAVVISSNTSSMPEIIGRTDAMFDPRQPKQIAEVLTKSLVDQDFRLALQNNARERANAFSWDKTAKIAIKAFEVAVQRQKIFKITSRTKYPVLLKALQRELKQQKNQTQQPIEKDITSLAEAIAQNTYLDKQKQILVDVSDLVKHDHRTGIQRVVRSIVNELQKNTPKGYKLRLVYGDEEHVTFRYVTKIGEENGILPSDPIVDFTNGDIFLGLDFTAHLFPRLNPALDYMNMVGVKIVYIVYDLIPVKHAHFFDAGMPRAFNAWLEALTERAYGLICISKAVADDVLEWLDQRPPIRSGPIHIGYFHLGADINSSLPTKGLPTNADQVLGKFKQAPTFIMVGTVEPRKGHRQVLAAFDQLWQQGHQVNLVIVGKIGWNMDNFEEKVQTHPQFEKSLIWLQKISDEYLEKVYSAAGAIIVASEAEGFGLPLIEAAQKSIPIIARDIPVFREVADNHAFYFSGLEPENLSQAIGTWLELNKKHEIPSSANMPWLTWSQSANQLMQTIGGDSSGWYKTYIVNPEKLSIELNTPIPANNYRLVFKSWYWWEGEYRWSSGKSSEIVFRIPVTDHQDFMIRLEGFSFGRQALQFELNGVMVHRCSLEGRQTIEFAVGAHLLQTNVPNSLTLYHEDATTPNSDDLRVLAYALNTLELQAQ
jgi:glycosyltransferase involved in cell wall biosynthesis